MSKKDMEAQRHVSMKIVLTNSINDHLMRVAQDMGARKSEVIRMLLVDSLERDYKGI